MEYGSNGDVGDISFDIHWSSFKIEILIRCRRTTSKYWWVRIRKISKTIIGRKKRSYVSRAFRSCKIISIYKNVCHSATPASSPPVPLPYPLHTHRI